MNAQTPIIPDYDEALIHTYGPAVSAMMGSCFGEELELRCRLLRAREAATAALQHCAAETVPIHNEIIRVSLTYAYAPADTDRLRALVQCLRRLISATAFADEAFGEGQGARG